MQLRFSTPAGGSPACGARTGAACASSAVATGAATTATGATAALGALGVPGVPGVPGVTPGLRCTPALATAPVATATGALGLCVSARPAKAPASRARSARVSSDAALARRRSQAGSASIAVASRAFSRHSTQDRASSKGLRPAAAGPPEVEAIAWASSRRAGSRSLSTAARSNTTSSKCAIASVASGAGSRTSAWPVRMSTSRATPHRAPSSRGSTLVVENVKISRGRPSPARKCASSACPSGRIASISAISTEPCSGMSRLQSKPASRPISAPEMRNKTPVRPDNTCSRIASCSRPEPTAPAMSIERTERTWWSAPGRAAMTFGGTWGKSGATSRTSCTRSWSRSQRAARAIARVWPGVRPSMARDLVAESHSLFQSEKKPRPSPRSRRVRK